MPFFSVITSTYNAAATLPRLLDSLSAQTCRDFNWIVQDGASTDATMEIVEHYRPRLPAVLAESKKDKGIYDDWNNALNRVGIQLGKWVLFLGADDVLQGKGCLARIKKRLYSTPHHVFFACGDIVQVDGMAGLRLFRANVETGLQFLPYNMPFCHTGLLTRGSLLLQTSFDASFQIAGDHDFLCRYWKKNNQATALKIIIARMSALGVSSTCYKEINKEKFRIRKKYFPIKYIVSYPKYIILYIDRIAHPIKIKLKYKMMNFYGGEKLWGILSVIRRKLLYRQLNRR